MVRKQRILFLTQGSDITTLFSDLDEITGWLLARDHTITFASWGLTDNTPKMKERLKEILSGKFSIIFMENKWQKEIAPELLIDQKSVYILEARETPESILRKIEKISGR